MNSVTFTMGSRMSWILPTSGMRDGLSTVITEPSRCSTSYTTDGAVVMMSMSNSRSRRSCTISMCNKPRKPQRKPKPSACDTSGSNISAASFSLSLSSESRSWSYSELSTGYRPANTCGFTSLKPGSADGAGLLASVTVSPTLASSNCLMPAMMKPTSPADRCGRCCDFGVNTPVCSHRWVAPEAISRILSLGLSTPLMMRTSMTTPT
ncbi:hypothetical protein D3C72_1536310 [compost metagenome]